MRHPSDWVNDLMEKIRNGKEKGINLWGREGFFFRGCNTQQWDC